MNVQELFLNGQAAIAVASQSDFLKIKEWMSINNLFLSNGEPASHLDFIDGLNVIWRNENGTYEYCAAEQKPISISTLCSASELVQEPKSQELTTPVELEMKVVSITPAVIDSNIKEFKKVIIPAVQKYKNIVVTQDNYKEVKKTLANINNSSKQINSYKVDVKKKANAPVIEFEDDVKEILSAYNEVVEPIKKAITKFENEAKEKKRTEYMAEITEMKAVAVAGGYLTQKYADQFEFDESWLNSSCSKKKMITEANKQLLELMDQEKKDKEIRQNNINALKATHANALRVAGLDIEEVNSQKYIDLLDQGMNVPQIIKYINEDVDDLAKTVNKEANKKVEEVKQQVVQEMKQETKNKAVEIVIKPAQELVQEDVKTPVVEEKTGEMIGFYTEDKVVAKIQPNQAPGRTFRYEYMFEGDEGVIKTLAKIMIILSKLNSTFKFSGKMVK